MRRFYLWSAFFLAFSASLGSGVWADDTSVFTIDPGVKPNVLILFDNSSSMANKIYDPVKDYGVGCPNPYVKETIYFQACCEALSTNCGTPGGGVDLGETASLWPWDRLGDYLLPEAYAEKFCFGLDGYGYNLECETCRSGGEPPCESAPRGCIRFRYLPYDLHPTKPRQWVDCDEDGRDDNNNEMHDGTLRLYKGNYLNWLKCGKALEKTRYEAAREAYLSIINDPNYKDKVNFGLMVFKSSTEDGGKLGSDGGLLLVEIKDPSDLTQLQTQIDSVLAKPGGGAVKMYTPLAEALTHAGMYFEGKLTGANFGIKGRYYEWDLIPSPIKDHCQGNYVVLITDGNPTYDMDVNILKNYLGKWPATAAGGPYAPNQQARFPDEDTRISCEPQLTYHYDITGKDPRSSINYSPLGDAAIEWKFRGKAFEDQHLLDNVADYLYNADLRPDLSGTQNVVTYVIGFGIGNQLLRSTAKWGSGGKYPFVRANNTTALINAFTNLLDDISPGGKSGFSSTAIPSEGMVSGGYLYFPVAYPAATGNWSGDLKKYAIQRDTVKEAVNIIESQTPVWSVEAKLKERAQGGADTRNIYTVFVPGRELTDKQNAFELSNKQHVNSNVLAITGTSISREKLIQYIRGFNYDPTTGKNTPREKILGDILHSSPLVVKTKCSGKDCTVVFFGANDGMIHAIDDASGAEKWAFIPPDLLSRLKFLYLEGSTKLYFVDSSPKLAELNSKGLLASANETVDQRILVFGLRRGGSYYYALDITDADFPRFLWKVPDTGKASDFAELTQTWSEPAFGNMKINGIPTPVVFFGAGYDPENDTIPTDISKIKGRGVYAVDLRDGRKVWSKTYADLPSQMIYSIPSTVLLFDIEEDGIVDRLYVGDLGGQMWAFNLNPKDGKDWSQRLLFKAPIITLGDGTLRYLKIFYPPDLVKEKDGSYLYFGTGDRERPLNRNAQLVNRLYCVKDRDLPVGKFQTLTESDLVNLTKDELQESSDEKIKGEIRSNLQNKYGWYILLENVGEKCLASATVFLKVAYFTTYTPITGGCTPTGEARVYAIHYTDGQSVFNWDKGNDGKSKGSKTRKGKSDRVVKLNLGGIPSEVLIAILPPSKDASGKVPPGNAGGWIYPLVASGAGITLPGEAPMVNNLTPYSWTPVYQ